ncbi:MAG: hypothetical protein DWQ02_16120, partial [Bacteroidetes bacterium]
SVYFAFEELNAIVYRAVIGKTYPRTIYGNSQLKNLDVRELWAAGYTSIRTQDVSSSIRYANLPLQILRSNRKADTKIRQGQNPGLLIQKNGQTHFVVVNGKLYDLRDQHRKLGDWLR